MIFGILAAPLVTQEMHMELNPTAKDSTHLTFNV